MPSTIIVTMVEMIKLFITILRLKGEQQKASTCLKPIVLGAIFNVTHKSFVESWKFLIPSVFYAINNNIYYVGISLVPPPIWFIMCSGKTALTALIYKVNPKFQSNDMLWFDLVLLQAHV